MRYFFAIFILLLTSCSFNLFDEPGTTTKFFHSTIKSFDTIEVTELNKIIVKAIDSGENWPYSPALIAFNVLGGDKETRTLNFSQEANRLENPDIVISELIRDGFPDDSVRGDWHRLKFSKEPDNTWRIIYIQKASRCWRRDSIVYQSGPCP
jgi:hypothetical protein